MTRTQWLGLVVTLPSAALILIVVTAVAVLAVRHLRPTEPLHEIWTQEELERIKRWETVFVSPSGLHEVIAPLAHQQIADTSENYIPRHDLDEVPPSTLRTMLQLNVVERAKALTAELRNYNWRPNRPYRTHFA